MKDLNEIEVLYTDPLNEPAPLKIIQVREIEVIEPEIITPEK